MPERERQVLEENPAELDSEELREFMEADRFPVSADPSFKEQLRRRLWDLVRSRRGDDDPGE